MNVRAFPTAIEINGQQRKTYLSSPHLKRKTILATLNVELVWNVQSNGRYMWVTQWKDQKYVLSFCRTKGPIFKQQVWRWYPSSTTEPLRTWAGRPPLWSRAAALLQRPLICRESSRITSHAVSSQRLVAQVAANQIQMLIRGCMFSMCCSLGLGNRKPISDLLDGIKRAFNPISTAWRWSKGSCGNDHQGWMHCVTYRHSVWYS